MSEKIQKRREELLRQHMGFKAIVLERAAEVSKEKTESFLRSNDRWLAQHLEELLKQEKKLRKGRR